MKKNIFFILLLVTFAFAAKPVPFEYNKVRILYVIDSFDDEKVEAVLPRSVIDSILQDVDSVYFAPFGACDCDCAGGDIIFYPSNKENARALFKTNSIARLCSSVSDSLDLVLRLKDNRKIKTLGENLLKQNENRPKKRMVEDDDEMDDARLIFILDSTVKAQKNKSKLKK